MHTFAFSFSHFFCAFFLLPHSCFTILFHLHNFQLFMLLSFKSGTWLFLYRNETNEANNFIAAQHQHCKCTCKWFIYTFICAYERIVQCKWSNIFGCITFGCNIPEVNQLVNRRLTTWIWCETVFWCDRFECDGSPNEKRNKTEELMFWNIYSLNVSQTNRFASSILIN